MSEQEAQLLLWACDSRLRIPTIRTLANYQSGFDYKFTNGWYARSDSTGIEFIWTHPNFVNSRVTIDRSCMTPKFSNFSSLRSQCITERNTTSALHAWQSVSKNSRWRFSSIRFFRRVLSTFVAKRYPTAKVSDRTEKLCLLGTRWCNF